MDHKKKIGLLLVFLLAMVGNIAAGQEPLQIEIANQSGVAGYPITIFGSGFGEQAGEVMVLGESAEISYWTPTAVRATIPEVNDGQGELAITASDGQSASSPFTVYSIDPAFLAAPTETYKNILSGRQAMIEGFEWSYCAAQPSNEETKPELFLSNYRCGYKGIVRSGLVVLGADSDLGKVTTIAYQFSQPLSGEHIFQFVTDNVWYERQVDTSYLHSVPETYFLEVSADSTNGSDGNWETVFEMSGNKRSTRMHRFEISAESNATWFRMRVTDGLTNFSEEFDGRDFALRELRLYSVTGDSRTRPDAAAIYGDSLTADAFEALGFSGLPHAVKQLRGGDNDLIFTSYGLAGQNSSGLEVRSENNHDIYDAFALDDAATQIRYWFIGLGTNDAFDGSAALNAPNTNLYEHERRLDQFVQDAVVRGLVPIVARIPQTDESKGGFGDFASKQHVLGNIDRIAARYRLIPGPDFYSEFRLNLETDGGSFYGDDGTHHVDLGGQRLINGWAASLVDGFGMRTEAVAKLAEGDVTTSEATAVDIAPTVASVASVAEEQSVAETVADSSQLTPVESGEVISAESNRPMMLAITPICATPAHQLRRRLRRFQISRNNLIQ